jgi:general secretion pathway protein G
MRKTTRPFNARTHGFSLIEFLAVLALMAIVAGIVTMSVRPLMVKGKQDAARAEVSNICSALEAYFGVYGRYPSNDEGLAALRRKSEKLTEPLLTQDPIDPWGHAYQYNAPGRQGPYEVICFGDDGREGGTGGAKDIVSWDLKDGARK